MLYQGSTPKFLVRILNELNVQLDPSNNAQVTEVLIFIFNAIDNTDIAKFYLNTSLGTGWSAATINTVATGDKRVQFILTAAQTAAAMGNRNKIQLTITLPDTGGYLNNKKIIIKQGLFFEINPAKTI